MSKIDITEWKAFRIRDLFETIRNGKQVHTGANVKATSLRDGTTPRITVSGMNNGVIGRYTSTDKNYRTYENFISVSFLGTVFYHPYEASLDMKVHCLKPLGDYLNDETGMFLVSSIRKAISHTASYADQISSTMLPDMVIYLPATPDGEPDWAYMEAYIKGIREDAEQAITLFGRIAKTPPCERIDATDWKEFKLGGDSIETGLFRVYNGTKYVKSQRREGPLPLISNTGMNNGEDSYIEDRPDSVYKNFITVAYGSGTGISFYHSNRCFVGETVMGLVPNFKLTPNIGLFLVAILNEYGASHYAYDRKPKVNEYRNIVHIKLPATPDGDPDWNYMDAYIEQMMNETRDAIESLLTLDRS